MKALPTLLYIDSLALICFLSTFHLQYTPTTLSLSNPYPSVKLVLSLFNSQKRTIFAVCNRHFSHFMALPRKQTEASSHPLRVDSHQHEEVLDDTQLDHSLRLETFLRIFGFCQFPFISFTLSWVSFLLLGFALPLALIERSYCSDCEKFEIKSFEIEILVSESLVAAISLPCISHNLRKYGVKKFLFVDRYHGNMAQFCEEYLQKINVCSIVELVGIIIVLQSAAKISHRAQSLASVTSRWHALLTCNFDNASQMGISNNGRSMEAAFPAGPLPINYSESDLESIDYVPVPTNSQLASNMSLYHKRQALGN